MPKYKVGETVKCVSIQPDRPMDSRGCGFSPSKTFVIRKISMENSLDPIYWPSTGGGIYEHELEEHEWDG
jgi:hypothetical protein